MAKIPKIPYSAPPSWREKVAANAAAQLLLKREIAGLTHGTSRSAAEKKMLNLRTDLVAMNVEMRLRVGQESDNA